MGGGGAQDSQALAGHTCAGHAAPGGFRFQCKQCARDSRTCELQRHHLRRELDGERDVGQRGQSRLLLEAGPGAGAVVTTAGDTLGEAAIHGRLDAVEHLLAAGADPNDEEQFFADCAPLYWAVYYGKERRSGGHFGRRDVEVYSRSPDAWLPGTVNAFEADTGALLVEYTDSKNGLRRGLRKTTAETLHGDGKTVACSPAATKYKKIAGANSTSLCRRSIVGMLLDSSADPAWEHPQGGTAPLHVAAEHGDIDALRLLLKHRADPNVEDRYRSTPLHVAAERGDVETLQLLLDHGADPNAEDQHNSTPVNCAAQWGKTDCHEALLKAGAHAACKPPAPGAADDDNLYFDSLLGPRAQREQRYREIMARRKMEEEEAAAAAQRLESCRASKLAECALHVVASWDRQRVEEERQRQLQTGEVEENIRESSKLKRTQARADKANEKYNKEAQEAEEAKQNHAQAEDTVREAERVLKECDQEVQAARENRSKAEKEAEVARMRVKVVGTVAKCRGDMKKLQEEHRDAEQEFMRALQVVSEAYIEAAEEGLREGHNPREVEERVEAKLRKVYDEAAEAAELAVQEAIEFLKTKETERKHAFAKHAKRITEAEKARKRYEKEQKQADKAHKKAEQADLKVATQEEQIRMNQHLTLDDKLDLQREKTKQTEAEAEKERQEADAAELIRDKELREKQEAERKVREQREDVRRREEIAIRKANEAQKFGKMLRKAQEEARAAQSQAETRLAELMRARKDRDEATSELLELEKGIVYEMADRRRPIDTTRERRPKRVLLERLDEAEQNVRACVEPLKQAEAKYEEAKENAEERNEIAYKLTLKYDEENAQSRAAAMERERSKLELQEKEERLEREKHELETAEQFAELERKQAEAAQADLDSEKGLQRQYVRERWKGAIQEIIARQNQVKADRAEMDEQRQAAKEREEDLLRRELVETHRMDEDLYEKVKAHMVKWREKNKHGALDIEDLIAAWVYSMGPGEGEKPKSDPDYDLHHGFTIYSKFNRSMRNIVVRNQAEEEYKWLHYHLSNAVDHVDGAIGHKSKPLYRGQGKLYGAKYKVGTMETWRDYKSTSTDREAALEFAGKKGALFTLVDIRPNLGAAFSTNPPLSAWAKEREILLPAGATFVVTKHEKRDGMSHIELRYKGEWADLDLVQKPSVFAKLFRCCDLRGDSSFKTRKNSAKYTPEENLSEKISPETTEASDSNPGRQATLDPRYSSRHLAEIAYIAHTDLKADEIMKIDEPLKYDMVCTSGYFNIPGSAYDSIKQEMEEWLHARDSEKGITGMLRLNDVVAARLMAMGPICGRDGKEICVRKRFNAQMEKHRNPEKQPGLKWLLKHFSKAVNSVQGLGIEGQPMFRGQSSRCGQMYAEGEQIKWRAFRTAYLSRQSAEKYATGPDAHLFEIVGAPEDLGACFGSTSPPLAETANVDEIVLPAGASFIVKSVQQDSDGPTVVVLEHKGDNLGSDSDSDEETDQDESESDLEQKSESEDSEIVTGEEGDGAEHGRWLSRCAQQSD